MAEETVILNFEVDQGAAERQLERIEGVLLDNKKAVQDLQAAYKKGNVTQGEYVKENIRLQQNIKKEQDLKKTLIKTIETESNSRDAVKLKVNQLTKEYDGLNTKTAQGAKRSKELEAELKKLNAQLNKGDNAAGLFKNQIGNYPKVLGDAASQIRVAGVSLSDLGTKLTALANPITASVAVIGALGAAYARSTLGAKDLAFAQSQIAAATTLITNQFAQLITSAKDGEGAITTIVNGFLKFVDKIPIIALYSKLIGVDLADIAEKSKEIALAQEKLEDLARLELQVRANASERLEANQELMEDIANEQLTINERLAASQKIEDALRVNKGSILSVLNMELAVIEDIAEANEHDEDLQNKVLEKKQQINQESVALERQITKINKLQDDLNRKLGEDLKTRKEISDFAAREAGAPNVSLSPESLGAVGSPDTLFIDDPAIQASQARQEQFISELKTVEFTEAEKRKQAQITADFNKSVDQARVQSAKIIFTALSQLAEEGSAEQRALTLVSIALDTAQAIAGATAASQDIPYPGNLVAMATSIATVLSNIGAAYNAIKGFEQGGYTGPGRDNQIAGAVHANEYVAPAHVVRSPAAQPHLNALERMRGYQDGGFVANQSTAPVNQSLIIANALRQLPQPVVSWKEGEIVGKRVQFRENQATL